MHVVLVHLRAPAQWVHTLAAESKGQPAGNHDPQHPPSRATRLCEVSACTGEAFLGRSEAGRPKRIS